MGGEYRCHECREVYRVFYGQEELDHHFELRHGVKGKYGGISGPPPKPKASGADFESVYAVLTWEGELLEDQINELRARKNAVDKIALSIQQMGGLDHNGKSKTKPKADPTTKKAKTTTKPAAKKNQWTDVADGGKLKGPGTTKKKPASKAVASKPVAESKVGLPPSKGGTAPPGKPHWDKRAGRWTAVAPATKPRSDGATKRKAEKREPVHERAARFEREEFETEPELHGDGAEVDGGVDEIDAAEGHVEAPLGYVLHNNKPGASDRWRQSRVSCETDEGLLSRINYELGDKGNKMGPDWSAVWQREKGSTWITIMMEGAEPVRLEGAALVEKVRAVLDIDVPAKVKKAV